MKQYRSHLLVCAGTACVSYGSFKIKEALEKEVKKRNLQDEVLVIATGCNGFCERGPIVMVHPRAYSISGSRSRTFLCWSKST